MRFYTLIYRKMNVHLIFTFERKRAFASSPVKSASLISNEIFNRAGHDAEALLMISGVQFVTETDPSSLWRASVFVKTSPDKSPRLAPHDAALQKMLQASCARHQASSKRII
jgi:hypothetical protein